MVKRVNRFLGLFLLREILEYFLNKKRREIKLNCLY